MARLASEHPMMSGQLQVPAPRLDDSLAPANPNRDQRAIESRISNQLAVDRRAKSEALPGGGCDTHATGWATAPREGLDGDIADLLPRAAARPDEVPRA